MFGCTKSKTSSTREFRLFTGSEYFRDDIIKEFEAENNVKVRLDYFSSNEQLLAKIQLSAKSAEGPDLIMPSDYIVKTMVDMDLLKPLDRSKLIFIEEFDSQFTNPPYDPHLKYTVPMAIGTTGMAINTKLAPKIDFKKGLSWKEALENPAYKGLVTLLDDPREVLNVALMIGGKKFKEASAEDIKSAFSYLKTHKGNLRAFTAETRPVIEADECAICQAYSGDALLIAKNKPEIKFLIAKEGGAVWTDNFAIPKNGKNDDLAYAFMKKMLSAEGAKRFTENINYRTANKKAMGLISELIAKNPVIFPPPKEYSRLSFLAVSPALLATIDRQLTELKSQ